MESKEKNKNESPADIVDPAPVIETGKKKVHHGHPYKKGCPCAMCSKITAKNERDEIFKQQIIKEYQDSLPKEIVQFELTEEMMDLIENKMPAMKQKITTTDPVVFINTLINESLRFYIHSL